MKMSFENAIETLIVPIQLDAIYKQVNKFQNDLDVLQ